MTRQPKPHPGHVVYCTVIDALKIWVALTDREPTTIRLTKDQAYLIESYHRTLKRGPLLSRGRLLGAKVETGCSDLSFA